MTEPAPRTAGERYDWECEHVLGRSDQDLPWLESVARQGGGPVLELACGTGRVTVPLARATGLPVVGLDLDPSMLACARRRGATRLVRADMTAFALAPLFAVVVVPYNSIQLVDGAARRRCLSAAAAALAPGGLVALECTDFQRDVVVGSVAEVLLASSGDVSLYGSVQHDLQRRCSLYHRRFVVGPEAAAVTEDHTTIWSLTADDVVAMVEGAGLHVAGLVLDGPRTRCIATLQA